ncbi:MAG TPA: hypothetical protein VHS97_05520 [Isosphaeraceae bacterium]|nr:hypothetical protein [Isosphaeraceae bacterium]
MRRTPPTTEPFSRNSLDATFVWMLADQKERQCAADVQRPRDVLRSEIEYYVFALRELAERKHRPLVRIGSG